MHVVVLPSFKEVISSAQSILITHMFYFCILTPYLQLDWDHPQRCKYLTLSKTKHPFCYGACSTWTSQACLKSLQYDPMHTVAGSVKDIFLEERSSCFAVSSQTPNSVFHCTMLKPMSAGSKERRHGSSVSEMHFVGSRTSSCTLTSMLLFLEV